MAEREIVGQSRADCYGATGSLRKPVSPKPRILAYLSGPPTVDCLLKNPDDDTCKALYQTGTNPKVEGGVLCRFLVPQEGKERFKEEVLRCRVPGFERPLIYSTEDREIKSSPLWSEAPAEPVIMTPAEGKIVEVLMENHGRYLAREVLVRAYSPGGGKGLEVLLHRIRTKLGEESDRNGKSIIQSAKGLGYRIPKEFEE